ncbi:MAG: type I restriction-modification system subunit M [Vampirovibrionia bacterium]
MAIKKSQLYSSIWKSCDELRGGMDASQYKDYVLVLLFIKYISDKYAGVPYAPITIPEGSSFKDMVALKGKKTIGEDINTLIIAPIAKANQLSEMPDFDNAEKLGSGPDQVKKLSNLIAIFENPALDFSKNRAEGDDILGDAYEYLMRHFATESGKSKGQFYTPAEVSKVVAKVIGIADTTNNTPTIYDPTCGSGSLLLKVSDETEKNVKLYGQENDNATAALARMNMILHDNPTAIIERENTLATPKFKDGEQLKTFDYVVANPPFSFKSWSNGVNDPDEFGRFENYGRPPAKNGDYAFLLHIIRSLKATGKGACILPHGVLFRGNAEAEIRTNILRRGYIKGIIGLPANLFYGTGIPACIIVLDKENAETRKEIFIIDASKGFMKDGNKNRLRSQDIHKIVDVFNKQIEIPKYSRMVSLTEIEKNEYNLNIPRYIDSQEAEDMQDIEAHLRGGIPNADIETLQEYWNVYPNLKASLFSKADREGYSVLNMSQDEIKNTIFSHPEFTQYSKDTELTFNAWKERSLKILNSLSIGIKPKEIIHQISEDILEAFSKTKLINQYDIYQRLMEYWSENMQDDMYIVASDGWKAELTAVEGKTGELESDLVPKQLVINRYFETEKQAIEELEANLSNASQELEQLVEEHSAEDSFFTDFDKVNKTTVGLRIKEIKNKAEDIEELKIMEQYLSLQTQESEAKRSIKEAQKALETQVIVKYKELTEADIKTLVIDDKWMLTIEQAVQAEKDRISQRLTKRIKELAERYESTLPELVSETEALTSKVEAHLNKMGYAWT